MTLRAIVHRYRGKTQYAEARSGLPDKRTAATADHRFHGEVCMIRRRAHGLSKAELRAAAELAVAQSSKPIVKLPTKLTRQCGRCGELASVMVEPGQPAPEFKCKKCDS
jgi:hypothetical protein